MEDVSRRVNKMNVTMSVGSALQILAVFAIRLMSVKVTLMLLHRAVFTIHCPSSNVVGEGRTVGRMRRRKPSMVRCLAHQTSDH
ncbi:uncharacterized protein LAESUDRAFT_720010 [Laetiporus sulphureus 93-53]|uniref:Uncharacterized protein n=1 Tax=Laetiporus sulphureus 93-53 TaxID=1314785 RepID=A0A165HQ92_9APHY|nr:uncharacterized protein LAESUDRAFT_720010 [Laetiporus sulphureus 93-53]KZT12041.1 hypothetical protein LAESUDRAFT_720010 [Laetiporus sulphureus 93-53]